jgi:hypothetical protein
MNFLTKTDDPHRITNAMLLMWGITRVGTLNSIPEYVKWQLNAYTNWNLTLITCRIILGIPEWDPFLCVNSMGIFWGFRTAFTQGLDDNIRKKLSTKGLSLTPLQFKLGDHICHSLPAWGFLLYMARCNKRVPFVSVTYAVTLMTWFALHSGGKFDASDVYVPHPSKRAWLSCIVSMVSTPSLVSSLRRRRFLRSVILLLVMTLPYTLTRLDSSLKATYNFRYACTASRGTTARAAIRRSKSCTHIDGES